MPGIDATGLRVHGAGEWLAEAYGARGKRSMRIGGGAPGRRTHSAPRPGRPYFRSTASQLVRLGGKKWFFGTADYVLGHAPYPFPETTDFSSYLIQAQSSGADLVGFAPAGPCTAPEEVTWGVKRGSVGAACQLADGMGAGQPLGQPPPPLLPDKRPPQPPRLL